MTNGGTDAEEPLRFLVVYERDAKAARDVLAEYFELRVILIVARNGEVAPGPAEAALLRKQPDASTFAAGVGRKYRKALHRQYACRLEHEPNEFRRDDQLLRTWLRGPAAAASPSAKLPSVAFSEAAARSGHLLLADNCLVRADEIAEHRFAFAARAADVLSELANAQCETGERLDEWFQKRELNYANSGQVVYSYPRIGEAGGPIRSYAHLKSGDRTTPQSAARIYFDIVESSAGKRFVVVFYCGPHPADGGYTARFSLPE